MYLKARSSNRIYHISEDAFLAKGGEGCIYSITNNDSIVAKVYHSETDEQRAHLLERARKVECMILFPPISNQSNEHYLPVAWPKEALFDMEESTGFRGYLMVRVHGINSIKKVYTPEQRSITYPLFTHRTLLQTALHLARAMQTLHASGYVIGDVHESNILVSEDGQVTFVDTDSFEVGDPRTGERFRSAVGKPEFSPPELQKKNLSKTDRSVEHDLFGLAVIIFQLLMEGQHPFSGISRLKSNPTMSQRIAKGYFPYGSARRSAVQPLPSSPPFDMLHPNLQRLFLQCFEIGQWNPTARPTTQIWIDGISEVMEELQSCRINALHIYSNHFTSCPWCARKQFLHGLDPFPSVEEVKIEDVDRIDHVDVV